MRRPVATGVLLLVAAGAARAWELNADRFLVSPPPLYLPTAPARLESMGPTVDFTISAARLKAHKVARGTKARNVLRNGEPGISVDHGVVLGPGAKVVGSVVILDERQRSP